MFVASIFVQPHYKPAKMFGKLILLLYFASKQGWTLKLQFGKKIIYWRLYITQKYVQMKILKGKNLAVLFLIHPV